MNADSNWLLIRLAEASPFLALIAEITSAKPSDAMVAIVGELTGEEISHDDFGAEAYDLFVHNLPPVASLYLCRADEEKAELAARLHSVLRLEGIEPRRTDLPLDHLANLLAAVVVMSERGSDNVEDFTHEFIIPWLSAFTAGVRLHGSKAFAELFSSLSEIFAVSPKVGLRPDELRPPFQSTTESIGSFIDRCLTPLDCGLFLTRTVIRSWQKRLHFGVSWAPRAMQLRELFESCADQASLPELFEAMRHTWKAHQGMFDEESDPWARRLVAHLNLLKQMEQSASSVVPTP